MQEQTDFFVTTQSGFFAESETFGSRKVASELKPLLKLCKVNLFIFTEWSRNSRLPHGSSD